MKPFSKRHLTIRERIFNYRLSRARRIVENAFGILAHRYQCLLTTMRQKPPTVVSIVLACICLHNLTRMRYPAQHNAEMDQEDGNHIIVPGAWRLNNPLAGIYGARGNRMTTAAKHQRQYLSAYYVSQAGSVHWQDIRIWNDMNCELLMWATHMIWTVTCELYLSLNCPIVCVCMC